MTIDTFVRIALAPALTLLPEKMDSLEARAFLTAIGLHESSLAHRRQIQGPARSYLQFETVGIRGVFKHERTAQYARDLCAALDVLPNVQAVHRAIEFQDVLAVGLGRLLLWTLPLPLPTAEEPGEAYRQYRAAWRPNPRKTRADEWPGDYRQAWRFIAGES